MKLPFFQFYPADWLQDTQILSLEEQGAWIKILCALHAASERGRKMSEDREWKQFLGYPQGDRALELIANLGSVAEIEFKTEDGKVWITITSRRMMRDEAKRKQELTRKQAYEERNPARHKRSDDDPTVIRQSSDAIPTPILHTSEFRDKDREAPGSANPPDRSNLGTRQRVRSRLPDNFELTPERFAVAVKHGVGNPEAAFEAFKANHRSKGSMFLDWEQTWLTWCLREKEFRRNGQPAVQGSAGETRRTGAIERLRDLEKDRGSQPMAGKVADLVSGLAKEKDAK